MKATTAVTIATLYLVLFYIFLNADSSPLLFAVVFLSMPVIIIGMVFTVLLDDSYDYPELDKDGWGYADKKKEELGMF
jgi:hypothetical protein